MLVRYSDNENQGGQLIFLFWINTNFVYSYEVSNVFLDQNSNIIPEGLSPRPQKWGAENMYDQVVKTLIQQGYETY